MGYAAMAGAAGQRRPDESQVVNYKSYLESRQNAVLASVGGSSTAGYVFNGWAAG
jgi:hypothetical protein